jgi:hypothetical protein
MLILAGAAGGTLYWPITIRLRAVLAFLPKRLLCSAKSRAPSCAFF